jgi:hypothetical protein
MTGSIFPENWCLKIKYSIARPNALLSLITMNINELGAKKKDFPEVVSEKSCLVDPQGLEP